jgi:D-alanyl-D-alanine carboxypeptidase
MTLNSLIAISELAHSQVPSKMGFKPGTQVTLDNAMKMMMVRSANDIAVAIAEGVSGSVENFSAEMNAAAQRLGMTQSNFVNPNGLPDPRQVTSARDLAILARALIREFPEYDLYWHIPAIKFGKRIMRNYNKLIDRYPGADGMKTGFICASGNMGCKFAASDTKRHVLGGMGSVAGALLGGLFIGVVESLCGLYLGESLGQIGIFAMFILVLLLRPSGLFGARA